MRLYRLILLEQIYTTQAKSQWIVGQSPLSHLQYLDAFKSSTRDLSFQIIFLLFSDKITILFKDCNRSPFEFEQQAAYTLSACVTRNGEKHCLSGMDSDLEAFSRYPADGSVAALAFQPTALTKYLNELFLSY